MISATLTPSKPRSRKSCPAASDAAFYAAQRANAAALDDIKGALDLLREATARQRHREDADLAFHLAVAKATNNHYYASSMRALQEHIAVGMKLHGLSLMGPDPSLERVFAEHRAIFDAIAGREAADAANACGVTSKGRATACSRASFWTCHSRRRPDA